MPKQVTHSGMIWLLAAQLLVMLPFALDLPLWLIPVLGLSAWWRLRVLAGKVAQPSQASKLLIMALGIGGLLVSGLQFPSLDAMAALLLLGFAFKAVEVTQRRDALVVIFVGFFLVALHFLYAQNMGAALCGVLCLTVLTAALIGVQFPTAEWTAAQNVRQNLRLAVFMLLQCLPLMVLLFIFAPRFQPLWTLPLATGQSKTGISDHMAPGDIESLSQSDELAFRVTFKGVRPPQNQLYWRGLVLNYFDGKTWQQFAQSYETWELKNQLTHLYAFNRDQLQIKGLPLEYEAVYEKTGQPWLFTLTPPVQAQGDVIFGADYRLMANQDLQAPLLLKVVSYPDAIRDTQLSPAMRQLALQLPVEGDARSRTLAQQLRQQATSESAYVDAVLQRFRQQQFAYTLRPPNMGDSNTIDAFLFDQQRGFCAHYAGSFVYLMRAAGIPARVVIGYQGGEWNDKGQYLSVHQYDAHAWAEVWLAGKGWVQIDPTLAIAPERAEQGLEAAVKTEGTFLANQRFSTRNVAWLNKVQQQFDTVQYGWQRWVLGYDSDMQRDFFARLLGQFSLVRLVLLVGGLFALIALFWALSLGLARRREREALEHQLYRRFCAILAKRGVTRAQGQVPSVFAQQAAAALPKQAEVIQTFTRVYEGLCYDPEANHTMAIRQLRGLLKQL